MLSDTQIVLRLLLAATLGGLVGYERQRNNQPAGLRTHIILVVGATLAMTLSINLAMEFRPQVPNGDPVRLAAQVISGIRIHKDLYHKRVKFVMTFKMKEGELIDEMLVELTGIEGIRAINYE